MKKNYPNLIFSGEVRVPKKGEWYKDGNAFRIAVYDHEKIAKKFSLRVARKPIYTLQEVAQ